MLPLMGISQKTQCYQPNSSVCFKDLKSDQFFSGSGARPAISLVEGFFSSKEKGQFGPLLVLPGSCGS
jgi:hypothetical protein